MEDFLGPLVLNIYIDFNEFLTKIVCHQMQAILDNKNVHKQIYLEDYKKIISYGHLKWQSSENVERSANYMGKYWWHVTYFCFVIFELWKLLM